jgi:nucleotide-binding universal stress UspA family protein
MKILLAYDGSPDAKAAVARCGALFDGQTAIVLSVWEGFSEVLVRAGSGFAAAALDFDEIDRSSEAEARRRAEEGAGHARAAGLAASSRVARRGVTIWETILEEAAEVGADLIVLGTRGLTGVKSMLLGSTSRAVLQHADRPVLIVPAPDTVRRRAEQRHGHQASPADTVAAGS